MFFAFIGKIVWLFWCGSDDTIIAIGESWHLVSVVVLALVFPAGRSKKKKKSKTRSKASRQEVKRTSRDHRKKEKKRKTSEIVDPNENFVESGPVRKRKRRKKMKTFDDQDSGDANSSPEDLEEASTSNNFVKKKRKKMEPASSDDDMQVRYLRVERVTRKLRWMVKKQFAFYG